MSTYTPIPIPIPIPRKFASATANVHFSVGSPVCLAIDGNAELSIANTTGNYQCVGLATMPAEVGEKVLYVTTGYILSVTDWTNIVGTTALVENAEYFLDPTTAGKLTTTIPTISGDVMVSVGKTTGTSILQINVCQPVIIGGE